VSLSVSFEVFPPKTTAGLQTLADTVAQLDRADPAYISVTYGAGGTDRQRSFEAIDAARGASGSPVAGHLTCVGQSRRDVEDVIDRYNALGVRHVVALRGDPPGGIDAPYEPHPDGFASTADLVAAIKQRGDLDVSVSAYPERHPQSPNDDHDLAVLAA
jgi:methylenetetrahydrofolate reductase (NADPH)